MTRTGSAAAALVCLSTTMFLAVQASPQGELAADEKMKPVVATVGGEPILVGDVERRLEEFTRGREVNSAVLPEFRLRAPQRFFCRGRGPGVRAACDLQQSKGR